MVSNRKFSKVYDLVAKFEKKSSQQTASIKNAQVMSSVEQEAALKREIEELMTKGVSSAVKSSWTQLVSAVTQLKSRGKLPANLDALAYYQVIVHGGVAYDRRVRFAAALPKVVMDLAILASEQNVTSDDTLITLSKTLNGPCDGIKTRYAQLVKLQDSNKTERDRNDFEERSPTPKDSVKVDTGKTLSLEEATAMVKGFLRELSVDGNRQAVLEKFNVQVRPYLKMYSKDPDFNKSVRALVDAGIPVDPMANLLNQLKRKVAALQGLKGDAKRAKSYSVIKELSEAGSYFKNNQEFSEMAKGVIDEFYNASDAKLRGELDNLRSFT